MFLDCEKKPEYPEETHADTGRACKLRTETNPGPSCCEATALTTAPLCHPSVTYNISKHFTTVPPPPVVKLHTPSSILLTIPVKFGTSDWHQRKPWSPLMSPHASHAYPHLKWWKPSKNY